MSFSNFETKKIMADDGSDFPIEFYIELYKRYPSDPTLWVETIENFTVKDGKYYDDFGVEFTFQEIQYGCYCLYHLYDPINSEDFNEKIDVDIYFIDKMEGKKYTSKNVKNYLSDPQCISLCEELGYDYIYEVPAYIDSLTYKNGKYMGNIEKDEIINDLLEYIKNGKTPVHHATIILLEKDLKIEDLDTNLF
jgi:hypothetical protein